MKEGCHLRTGNCYHKGGKEYPLKTSIMVKSFYHTHDIEFKNPPKKHFTNQEKPTIFPHVKNLFVFSVTVLEIFFQEFFVSFSLKKPFL